MWLFRAFSSTNTLDDGCEFILDKVNLPKQERKSVAVLMAEFLKWSMKEHFVLPERQTHCSQYLHKVMIRFFKIA